MIFLLLQPSVSLSILPFDYSKGLRVNVGEPSFFQRKCLFVLLDICSEILPVIKRFAFKNQYPPIMKRITPQGLCIVSQRFQLEAFSVLAPVIHILPNAFFMLLQMTLNHSPSHNHKLSHKQPSLLSPSGSAITFPHFGVNLYKRICYYCSRIGVCNGRCW